MFCKKLVVVRDLHPGHAAGQERESGWHSGTLLDTSFLIVRPFLFLFGFLMLSSFGDRADG